MCQILNSIDSNNSSPQYIGNNSKKYKELTALIESELDTNVVEGTELNVSDSAEYKGPVMPGANLEQKQLSGKNKLNSSKIEQTTKNGITCSYDENTQEITFNGTCTADNTVFVFKENQIPIIQNVTKLIAYYSSGSVSGSCDLRCFDSAYEKQVLTSLLQLQNNRIIAITSSHEFIATNNSIRFNNGAACDNFKFKVMISDDNNTDFEEYCGGHSSPNPDYPQEIKVVTRDNVVKHVGSNYLPTNFSDYESGHYSTNGYKEPNGGRIRTKKLYPVKPNTTYYFKVLVDSSISQDGIAGIIREYSANSTNKMIRNIGIIRNQGFTTSENTKFISFTLGTGTGTLYDFSKWEENFDLIKFQLAEETPEEYEPYREEEYELSLGNMELCKIDDYQDILFKNVVGDENYNAELEEGAWYKKNVIGIISGSNQFTSNGMDDNRVGLLTPVLNIEANLVDLREKCFCNLLQTMQKNYSGLNGTTLNGKIRVYVSKEYVATCEEAKQLLEDIIIYFVQLNPTYTKITDPTLISQLEALSKAKWFKGVNHWWTETENLEPVLKGTYKQSNNLRIKEQDERLTNLESRLALLE